MTAAVAGDVKIRDAKDADLAAIVAIYNIAVATRISTAQLEQVTVEERRNWIREHSPDRPFWVAEVDGEVAAWLTIKPFIPRCAYEATVELSVYVGEKFRRRGLARKAQGDGLGCLLSQALVILHVEERRIDRHDARQGACLQKPFD